MNIYDHIVKALNLLSEDELTNENLHKIKKEFSKKYSVKDLPTNIQLQNTYKNLVDKKEIKENKKLQFLLIKRKIRSLS